MIFLFACEAPAPEPKPKPTVETAPEPGRYRRKRVKDPAMLLALGYVDGTQEGSRPPGVTIHDRDAIQPGNNLFVSGQGPEAHLIDVDGKVLHKWKKDWSEVFPDAPWNKAKAFPNHWRRALLLEDGSLFAMWGGQGLVRLDEHSNVVWKLQEPIHHDLELAPDGNLWTLSRRTEGQGQGRKIFDLILALDPATGEVKQTLDVAELIAAGPYAPMKRRFPSDGDLFHTNTIEWLDGTGPFEAGQLLVSFRHLDTIGVIDTKKEQLVWSLTGQWSAQHQPVMLESGSILLFDNSGIPARSRVLEVDPLTQQIGWSYGEGEGERFFSRILGSVQRLENGNTLITESNDGHAFEITPEGKRVWSYTVPFTAGSQDQFIASLYELVRLPEGFAFEGASALHGLQPAP